MKTITSMLLLSATAASAYTLHEWGTFTTVAGSDGVLLAGRFHSVAHETRGAATVHDLGEGRRIVRFSDFATSNGPDVRVYLVAAADASDNETVTRAGFIELGQLKGTEGDQNYEIPAGVDLATYDTVLIWCVRFSSGFGEATLVAP